MAAESRSEVYDGARDALFVRSDPMPSDAEQVRGVEFNSLHGRPIKVDDLIAGMTNTGFQASSVGKATQIINDMVCQPPCDSSSSLC